MSVEAQAGPRPIKAPEDFPVSWEAPEDEGLFWKFDAMHSPNQVTPLESDLWSGMTNGLEYASRNYEMPVQVFRALRINTYGYTAMIPVMASPEEMEARGRRAQDKMMAAMGRLGEMWEDELLPEIKEHLDHLAALGMAGVSMPELVEDLEGAIACSRRLGQLHFLTVLPTYLAMSEFDELYRDLFPSEGAFGSYRLLGGFSNKTLETGHALWALSRRALRGPGVRRVLEEEAAADVPAALEGSEEGRAFLAELRAYLEVYGERGDLWSITHPTWVEDPTPVIKNLKDYLTQPDEADPAAELRRRALDREQAEAEARQRLEGYPQPMREQFELLLKAAQTGVVLSEDHGFYIDFRGLYQLRRIILTIGRRLAEGGTLSGPEDVFLLTLNELAETMRRFPELDRRELAEQRRAEMERFRSVHPPATLGTAPPGPPPDDPFGRTMGKFDGPPVEAAGEPGVLRGAAGSPGKARGRARVIRSIAEAGKLETGDILVAETTAPPWTPLFASAAAVVTDTGGVLSHCAVVAREYGIPAVVGVGVATATIRDGQMIEVNGDAGVVRIELPA